MVLCVDEKSQTQALERIRPMLPMMPTVPARQTHDYVRHGVASLFAAFDPAAGTVIGQLHRRQAPPIQPPQPRRPSKPTYSRGSRHGTPTRDRSSGPEPPTKSSTASPHTVAELTTQDTRPGGDGYDDRRAVRVRSMLRTLVMIR